MRIVQKFQEGTGKKGVRLVVHTKGAVGGHTQPAYHATPFYNEQDSINFMNNAYDQNAKEFTNIDLNLPTNVYKNGGFYKEIYDPETNNVYQRIITPRYTTPNDTTYLQYNLNNGVMQTSSVIHSNDAQVPYVIMKNGKPFYLQSGNHYQNGKSVLYDIK